MIPAKRLAKNDASFSTVIAIATTNGNMIVAKANISACNDLNDLN